MAYSPLPTVNTGDPWTAANHNTYIRDNFAAGVPDIFTTKGDLAVASGADAASRLGAGADYAVLMARAGASLGVEWKRGAVEIFDTDLAAPAASIVISSIPAGFKHLLLILSARTDRAAVNDDVRFQFNGDAGVNYDNCAFWFNGGSVTVNQTSLDSEASCYGGTCTAASSPASAFGVSSSWIHDYADAGKHKSVIGEWRARINASAQRILHSIGTWKNTAAINEITIFSPNGANFVAGTRATLYGMG